MQLLLGLFFFSVLLTTGNSLSCDICVGQGSDCSDRKQDCTLDNAVCMKVTAEVTLGGQKSQSTIKSCSTKDICEEAKKQIGKTSSMQIPNFPIGGLIRDVTCSKAPPSFASFFPAFLGLLLMKLLF